MRNSVKKNKSSLSIDGKYIKNAIGYCNCENHPGALNRELAYKHKCLAKKCKWLEKYNEESWRLSQKYRNKR